MLSPVSVRICWIAAMAPALTEAANQADNFNLPASSNLNFASPTVANKLGLDAISLQTLSEIVGGKCKPAIKLTPGSEDLIRSQFQKCTQSWKLFCSDGRPNGKHALQLLDKRDGVADQDNLRPNRVAGSLPVCNSARHTMNGNHRSPQDDVGSVASDTSLELRNRAGNSRLPKTPGAEHPSGDGTNCNAALRRLATSDNFKNFQWAQNFGPAEEVATVSDVFSENGILRSRARHILHRIRKLQLRHIDCHTRGQLRSFVAHQQKTMGIPCQRRTLEGHSTRAKNTEELKSELLQSRDVKLLSTAALVELVRKLEHATSLAQSRSLCESYLNRDCQKLRSGLDPSECSDIVQTCGMLLGNTSHLESAADSDATESSSGGESADEATDDADDIATLRIGPPIGKKQAATVWAEDRAAAACRWIWLQAQVSDLEYKIRQQNDLYRQVRSSKGAVVLEGGSRAVSRSVIDSKEVSERSEVSMKSVNGFLDNVTNGYSTVRRLAAETEDSCRTRPLKRLFRKRRLVGAVRKTTKLSGVGCGCNSRKELAPCVLCGGRYNSTQTLDADIMPLCERTALLDPTCHMVLSFKQETPLSLHFERLLRREEYCKAVKTQLPIQKKARLAIRTSLNDQARKHSRKLTKNAAQTLLTSAKLRKKLATQPRRGNHRGFLLSSREDPGYRKKFKTLAAYRRRRIRRRSASFSSESSKPASPFPSVLLGPDSAGPSGKVSSLQELLRRRRLESAYDINNIVIPYSIAATTRVEKLQYKEILTPKWRLVDSTEETQDASQMEEEDEEDISDDTFAARHLKCELDEKRRFMGYKRYGRSRMRSVRCDSSGANTPDPASPHPPDDTYGWNSPVASPPSVLVQMEESMLAPVRPERRRTISISKRLSEDDRSSPCGDDMPVAIPYDRRVFPLTDDEHREMLHVSAHLAEEPAGGELQSPGISSSPGSIPDEDPDDPEWTVVMEGNRTQRASLILKLAKR